MTGWRTIYSSNEEEFFGTLIGSGSFDKYQRAGYWQWAMGYVTGKMGQPSVVDLVTTVSGWPEMSYWRDDYLCKKISTANHAELCGVQFSDPRSFTNFEALFNITQGDEAGYADPLPSSLYNLQTLKGILDAGDNSINILDPETKDVAFADAILPRRD